MGMFNFGDPSRDDIVAVAQLANAAYEGRPLPSGWQAVNPADLGLPATSAPYFVNGGAAAIVARNTNTNELAISFRGTNGPIDVFRDFVLGLGGSRDYINSFATLLSAVDDYATANSLRLLITGHSLGAVAANQLRDSGTRFGSTYSDATYVAFETPQVSASSEILNVGMKNDLIFKSVDETRNLFDRQIHESTTDNILFVNDAFVADSRFRTFDVNRHGIETATIPALERITASLFYEITGPDSLVVVDATTQAMNLGSFATWTSGYVRSYLLGEDIGDTIRGAAGQDYIEGRGGDDTLSGAGGDDRIDGGDNSDVIYGAAGKDAVQAGDGVDTVRGGAENDTIAGGDGGDLLYGEGGDDTLFGYQVANIIPGVTYEARDDSGIDLLSGGGGNDVLYGGWGGDTLEGGGGNDTFVYLTTADSNLDGLDVINGFGVTATNSDVIDLREIGVNTYSSAIVASGGNGLREVFFDDVLDTLFGENGDSGLTNFAVRIPGASAQTFVSGVNLLLADPPEPNEPVVRQPGPEDGEDVWITNVFSFDSDFGVDDNTLRVGGWNDNYHSLIQFDLAGLPQVAASATIELYHDLAWLQADNRIAPEMQLFRVDGTWDETLGWYTPQPEATYLANLPAAGDGWYEIDVTDLYNQWQAGTVANHGIELRPVTTTQNSTRFLSSDYLEDPSLRPRLVVEEGDAAAASLSLSAAEVGGAHQDWSMLAA